MIEFAEQIRYLIIRLSELSDAYYNLAQENEALKAEIRSLKKSTPEPEMTPCDYPDDEGHYHCPYDADGSDDCRFFCGLGVDE